jgi:hypothetical protein
MARIRGGEKFSETLKHIAQLVKGKAILRVGFLENATYPDGKPVGMIAAIQDFGAPRANIPPRPFFRNMIADKSPEWPKAIAVLLKKHHYDVTATFDEAGAVIAGQLRQSIVDTNSPPLKSATIRRKGFAKPLVDTGHMLNSIDHEVETS